ncbi:cAMP-dependent protein kinase type II-alpha regulatory subunit, partial [Larimichthys crocea]
CAEAFNPDDDDEDTEPRVVHPKTDEQRCRLQEACRDILLFKTLDQEQFSEVLDAMFESRVQPQEHVIDQGDDGDNFYVIERGVYDIVVSGTCVGQYNNKGSFGELALMYNTPRAATIIATQEGALWGLDRATFRRLIVKNNAKKRRMYECFIESVPLLKSLEATERMKIVDVLGVKQFSDGERIITQGDKADCFYVVESGEVKIMMKSKTKADHADNAEVEITRCSRGHYFGELALVTNKPRAASAYAVGDIKCLVIDVQAFERLLGSYLRPDHRSAVSQEDERRPRTARLKMKDTSLAGWPWCCLTVLSTFSSSSSLPPLPSTMTPGLLWPQAGPILEDRPFVVVWNMPTAQCRDRYNIHLDLRDFDIVENREQLFQGQKMTIFYRDHLGQYPYISRDGSMVNGGIPQLGDLSAHLALALSQMSALLQPNFIGLAVIDWEEWRPLWERNFGDKMEYRRLSKKLVRQERPDLSEMAIKSLARQRFEESTRKFMEETLRLMVRERPKGLWGFYGFPACFNKRKRQTDKRYTGRCHRGTKRRNNRLSWLWSQSTALYPSIYLPPRLAGSTDAAMMVSLQLCHGNGRCARRHPTSGHMVSDHNEEVSGKLFQDHFMCQCYPGWTGQECEEKKKDEEGQKNSNVSFKARSVSAHGTTFSEM